MRLLTGKGRGRSCNWYGYKEHCVRVFTIWTFVMGGLSTRCSMEDGVSGISPRVNFLIALVVEFEGKGIR